MRVRGLIAGAGAAMAGSQLVRGITQFAEQADDIGKTARQIGVGAEALQELRFAADRQGVSTRNLDKSLKAMNNRLGKVRAGQGQLRSILEETNPQLIQQLETASSSEEAFNLLMREMNSMESQAQKTALAQAAFSSTGRELVRMSEAGVEGIEALRQEARDTGVVMSEDATKGAEQFQDQMTNLKAVLTGVRNTALTPIIQDLTPLIKQFSEWVKENREMIALRVENTLRTIGRAVRALANAWESGLIPSLLLGLATFKGLSIVVGILGSIKAAITAVKAAQVGLNIAMAANPVGAVIAGISAAVAGVVMLIKNWHKVRSALKPVREAIQRMLKPVEAFANRVASILGITEEAGEKAQGLNNQMGFSQVAGESNAAISSRAGELSRNETVNRSQVDVNLSNLPAGTRVTESGDAPGVNLNYGYAQGGL
jgi:uncharacterized protein YoxC